MYKIIRIYLVGVILCILSASTWAAPIYLPTALAHTLYYFDRKEVFYNIDIYVKWEVAPTTTTGTYAGFQFAFENGGGGYFGTQIDSSGKKAIFSIWDIDDNSITALPLDGCVRFGHEGSGSSCIKSYEWIAGREYMVRIWALNSAPNGFNWGAWIKDTVTNEETQIGIITLKNNNGYSGYGWLTPGAIGFSEHYGYGSVDACHQLPYSKITWRGPYANNNEYTADKVISNFASTECNNSSVEASQRPFVTIESGGRAVRKTPSGSSLWENFSLSVSRQGNGSGSVKSTPDGLDCGSICSANFAANSLITLTAQAAVGSQFSGWSGACTGSSQQCNVRMTDAQYVTAYFTTAATTRLVTVTKAGNGYGSLNSNPSGLGCMFFFCPQASASFANNTAITLTASAAEGSQFDGWSGACTGTGACYIPPGNTSANVTANFNQSSTGTGDGGGTDTGPLADPARFVSQQYWDFIGITPDNATINDSVNKLKAGTITRAQFVQSLMDSDIFGVFFNRIVRLYTAYFKRLPDYSGLMYWYGNIYPLNPKGLRLEQISDAFAQSSEFFATYGQLSNAAFITRVYQNVLGRDPEVNGYDYWVGRLAQGMSRGEVMVGFSESTENQRASANSQLVTLTYVGLLRRVPQSAEHTRWLADIQAGRASPHDLINNLLQSPEYVSRF